MSISFLYEKNDLKTIQMNEPREEMSLTFLYERVGLKRIQGNDPKEKSESQISVREK